MKNLLIGIGIGYLGGLFLQRNNGKPAIIKSSIEIISTGTDNSVTYKWEGQTHTYKLGAYGNLFKSGNFNLEEKTEVKDIVLTVYDTTDYKLKKVDEQRITIGEKVSGIGSVQNIM